MKETKLLTWDFNEQVKMIDREMKAAEEWRKTTRKARSSTTSES